MVVVVVLAVVVVVALVALVALVVVFGCGGCGGCLWLWWLWQKVEECAHWSHASTPSSAWVASSSLAVRISPPPFSSMIPPSALRTNFFTNSLFYALSPSCTLKMMPDVIGHDLLYNADSISHWIEIDVSSVDVDFATL